MRTRELSALYIDEWTLALAAKNIAFVESRDILIDQLMKFEERPSFFVAQFKRTDIDYIQTNPTVIRRVLVDNTRIWPEIERQSRYDSLHISNRGEDVNGNKETNRFNQLLELFPELKQVFTFTPTVRGTLVDFIASFCKYPTKAIGIQISSARATKLQQFSYSKTTDDFLTYLEHGLLIVMIGLIDNKIAGMYLIPPTQDVISELKILGTVNICPCMLAKRIVSSDINKYLEKYRYLNPEFTKDVTGEYKLMSHFVGDFFNIVTEQYSTVVNTPDYFTSLFRSSSNKIEWLGNSSFTKHVEPLLNIIQTINHGERGDMYLHFKEPDFTLLDERRTLKPVRGIKSNVYAFRLRNQGVHGMIPTKVHVATSFVRDRIEPDKIIGFIPLPVIDSDGQLALRYDKPDALDFSLNCDFKNRCEWINVNSKFISSKIYPSYMVRDGERPDRIEIKAVFYYDALYDISTRLKDLKLLYSLISSRVPSEAAINAYNNAVTKELLHQEKLYQHAKRKNQTTLQK